MQISHNDKEITFTFPRYLKRQNPYMEEESDAGLLGEYPTFTGLIVRYEGYDEIGFAGTIDCDYKDKSDQVSNFIVMWNGTEEEFKKKCEELEINIHEIKVKA